MVFNVMMTGVLASIAACSFNSAYEISTGNGRDVPTRLKPSYSRQFSTFTNYFLMTDEQKKEHLRKKVQETWDMEEEDSK